MLLLPQVDLLLLAPLRIIMGASIAICYITVGGFTYPWLQAMGTQLCSYCISVAVDMRYRSIYRKLRAREAEVAANAAADAAGAKAANLGRERGREQVGGRLGQVSGCGRRLLLRPAHALHTRKSASVRQLRKAESTAMPPLPLAGPVRL